MKNLMVVSAVLLGSFLLNSAFAQDPDEQGIDVDKVVAMCEEKFNVETYSDENERNRLIDECIENHLNAGKPQPEEG